jgi:hypothetical protein
MKRSNQKKMIEILMKGVLILVCGYQQFKQNKDE